VRKAAALESSIWKRSSVRPDKGLACPHPMLEIHKQALAEEDLLGIWDYTFKKWGAVQADTYLDQLNEGITILAKNPRIGINCDHIRQGYRRFHIKHHMVYYRINPGQIDIVRILYEEMDPERHL